MKLITKVWTTAMVFGIASGATAQKPQRLDSLLRWERGKIDGPSPVFPGSKYDAEAQLFNGITLTAAQQTAYHTVFVSIDSADNTCYKEWNSEQDGALRFWDQIVDVKEPRVFFAVLTPPQRVRLATNIAAGSWFLG